ncbi:MAG: hypothetical protein H6825_03525 [Planctomycetes bacterium]|nr:hypothetical protein [Planctomycetota bacterium]
MDTSMTAERDAFSSEQGSSPDALALAAWAASEPGYDERRLVEGGSRSEALALLALERARPRLAGAWAWVLVFSALTVRVLASELPWLALPYAVLAVAGVPFVLRFGRRKRLAMLALAALHGRAVG